MQEIVIMIIEDKAKSYSSELKYPEDRPYWLSESNISENTVDIIPTLH